MPALASTKEKIVDTAARLFYSRGIRATTTDLIISEAGVHKSTFFKHFPTKAEVVVAYLKRRDDNWMDWLTTRLEALAKKPENRLIAIFDALGEWFSEADFRGCAFINVAAETADSKALDFLLAVEHKRRLAALVKDCAKLAHVKRVEQLVEEFMLLIEGAIVRAQMEGTNKSATTAKLIAKMLLAKNLKD
jgi:AcrR family transcriptional regulator